MYVGVDHLTLEFCIADVTFLCLWLDGTGDNFSVWVEPDKDDEATDALQRFFAFAVLE